MIPAHSGSSGKDYPSWDDLVAAEANGWVAVMIMQLKTKAFARVVGPFSTKREAQNCGASLRNKFKTSDRRNPDTVLLAVTIEPAWKREHFE